MHKKQGGLTLIYTFVLCNSVGLGGIVQSPTTDVSAQKDSLWNINIHYADVLDWVRILDNIYTMYMYMSK